MNTKLSISEICKWIENPNINPQSGRTIRNEGPMYQTLKKVALTTCENYSLKKGGIDIDNVKKNSPMGIAQIVLNGEDAICDEQKTRKTLIKAFKKQYEDALTTIYFNRFLIKESKCINYSNKSCSDWFSILDQMQSQIEWFNTMIDLNKNAGLSSAKPKNTEALREFYNKAKPFSNKDLADFIKNTFALTCKQTGLLRSFVFKNDDINFAEGRISKKQKKF